MFTIDHLWKNSIPFDQLLQTLYVYTFSNAGVVWHILSFDCIWYMIAMRAHIHLMDFWKLITLIYGSVDTIIISARRPAKLKGRFGKTEIYHFAQAWVSQNGNVTGKVQEVRRKDMITYITLFFWKHAIITTNNTTRRFACLVVANLCRCFEVVKPVHILIGRKS